jgi:hypothetical protein
MARVERALCPDCNQPWEQHDFGVPAPECPDVKVEQPVTRWNTKYFDPLNEVSK